MADTKVELIITKRTHPDLLKCMEKHYSQPKGFVGRNICFQIVYDNIAYGFIVAGSATLHLPGRIEFFKGNIPPLNNIVNNIFYHIERVGEKYPIRNFTVAVLERFVLEASLAWKDKYDDRVVAFESLVELPRKGELYIRNGWLETGTTKGYTCKRTSGHGTDDWSGKRVWDTHNLRPKRVFMKMNNHTVDN